MSVPTGWVRVTQEHVKAQGNLRSTLGHWVRLERTSAGRLRVAAHGMHCRGCQ